MKRLRPVKKYGNTFVITLTKSDVIDFNIKIGDKVDIEDMFIKKIKRYGRNSK